MKRVFFFLFTAVVLTACNSDDDNTIETGDYLIFGHYYGMCAGQSCVEIFKLTETKLYEDTNDNYSLDNLSFRELDHATFENVRSLISAVPQELLTDETSVFGCPDCADGGGLYIQLSQNGTLYTWNMDQIKENVPEYLHNFMDEVNASIALINNP
ncbi:hypothetical protein ES711_07955 [Gelidibacter salicanalis]|uniref:Type IV secretion system putative lipoprotein virB7 n=1 Tax=Gelidibacter salicanalis TaxID=291193 RepID=A0A5C7AJ42_9FLAO|nr:lipoprotein [Gelidibacter salicanalis]TXE08431.1 hypothetical protein ES711_07955 [Gelidibacter salicanalis]